MTETITIEVPATAKVVIDGVEYKPEPDYDALPEDWENGFIINGEGRIYSVHSISLPKQAVLLHYRQGNFFLTHSEAGRERDRREIDARIRRFVAREDDGWEANWAKVQHIKCYLCWDHLAGKIIIYDTRTLQDNNLYMSVDTAQKVLEHFTESKLRLWLEGDCE